MQLWTKKAFVWINNNIFKEGTIMARSQLLLALFISLALGLFQSVHATTVIYDVTNISGNRWENTYTVANDTLSIDIEEFTIFFTVGDFENLAVGSAPANWDPLVIQPDTVFPDDGFYDALALSAGIAPGSSLGGFSVQFDYLGTGTPGSQLFEIINPDTFESLDSGFTQAVPLPAAVWLFISGLIGLIGMGRTRSRPSC